MPVTPAVKGEVTKAPRGEGMVGTLVDGLNSTSIEFNER